LKIRPFHLAIQVRDLEEARDFYGAKLGFSEGRSDNTWIDFNMFGHQLVTHLNPKIGSKGKIDNHSNPVDGHGVPVPHFGLVLNFEEWEAFAAKLKSKIQSFLIEPHIRFSGQAGEQGTMFFKDPTGNAIEFKGFRDISKSLFEK